MDTEKMYRAYRPMLFSLAYRMLGSVTDAEDIVHEAFMAVGRLEPETRLNNEKAYLCKIVTNRCLNLLHSSAKQREVYVGTWLPEPLVSQWNADTDPSEIYQQKESLSTAYLLLLQQLNAAERAVFLLREVFEYSYDEIADVVGKSSFNCRQIFHRAKKNICRRKSSGDAANTVTESQVRQFIKALIDGDTGILLQLLAKDAIHYSDGGGKVQAVPHPVAGAANVIKFYEALFRWSESNPFKFDDLTGTPMTGKAVLAATIPGK
ncbi:sigma-70 family RNA polymerase sigma factor [Paenibacillus thailandensis]|uniref:sigma-70 family RNA polymerase sigma factor n=1 Tax=Paenibacillus thailandensis TaxID=393250 RepID=UPI003632405D